MDVRFPRKAGKLEKVLLERYYKTYYMYVHNIFNKLGANIRLIEDTAITDCIFLVYINKKKVVFDFSSSLNIVSSVYARFDISIYFKFHYSEQLHKTYSKVYPFPPVSFYNWDDYYSLEKKIKYTALGNTISCRQKPYGNARIRRAGAQTVIKDFIRNNKSQELFKNKIVSTGLKNQIEYWKDINNVMVALFIPGCRNNMLDRGHLQYLGFGCCTISPYIETVLPFNKKLIPNVHYLQCDSEYLDIIDIIKYAVKNPDKCKVIGDNAKNLFNKTCVPSVLASWLTGVIDGKYKKET